MTVNVSENTWDDVWFRSLANNEKLLFFWLLTRSATWCGIFPFFAARAAMELGADEVVVIEAIRRFKPKVVFDEHTSEIWIRNYLRWQTRHQQQFSPQQVSGLVRQLSKVASKKLLGLFWEQYPHVERVVRPVMESAAVPVQQSITIPPERKRKQLASPPPALSTATSTSPPHVTPPGPPAPHDDQPWDYARAVNQLLNAEDTPGRVIGLFLRYSAADHSITSEGQLAVAVESLRPTATKISQWPLDKAGSVMRHLAVECEKWSNPRWTLDTVIKYLTTSGSNGTAKAPLTTADNRDKQKSMAASTKPPRPRREDLYDPSRDGKLSDALAAHKNGAVQAALAGVAPPDPSPAPDDPQDEPGEINFED